jgi:amino acid adenylation domain-containing protein
MNKVFSTNNRHSSGEHQSDAPEIVLKERVADYNCFPLSFAQERLWFLNQILDCPAAYNIAGAVRLHGNLNKGALERALAEVIRRHESLRTSFAEVEGRPVQRIQPEVDFTLPESDLREPGKDVEEEQVRGELNAEAARPFVLSRPELLRARLLRVGCQECVLVLVLHHIIADGWSLGVLIREMKQLYDAFESGATPRLPELEIQYVDYAAWQRELWDSGEMQEGVEFWKRELAGAPLVLELPTDCPRRAEPSYTGSTADFSLGKELTGRLKGVSRGQQATLYMVLLAAFHALLSRYTGQMDIIVGSPVAERQQVEIENLIGLFVNLVPRRLRVEPNDNFVALLDRLRQSMVQSHAHQYVPFEKIVEELDHRQISPNMPLVQVAFVWQTGLFGSIRLGEMRAEPEAVETGTSKFDLTVMLEENHGEIKGRMEFRADLFRVETIQRFAQHYACLLEEIVRNPRQPVGTLLILDQHELNKVSSWSRSNSEYPRHQTIARLFQEVAAQRGEETAVIFGEQQVSYASLNLRANQTAHYLSKLGVKPESKVGVCMNRSVETIVGILGILKAGGVYVPLDPNCPPERLQYMLVDAGIEILLTQADLWSKLPQVDATVVCLDSDWKSIYPESTGDADARVDADNLAYVMYTSGSTGRPKGVAVTQRNVIRLVRNTNFCDLNEHHVFLQFAPISFDAATFEIWGALLNGGKLVIFCGDTSSIDELGKEIRRHQVTTLWLTAGLFHLFVDEKIDELRGIKQLLAGGDVLRPDAVRKVRAALPDCRMINGYGPTEATTFSCCYEVHGEKKIITSVPIGRPISNSSAYILDGEMLPVPVGVGGDLYVGGDGLSRGYWQRPDLTAEAFVPDTVSGEAGARLYRTGDRARFLPDGNIEFLGRSDAQVKIRGFRIEPGEVESALKEQQAVRDCAVLIKNDAQGNKQLVAYVVLEPTATQDSKGLRARLKAHLPEYMIPATFVCVDEIPLTPHGKVDKSALPDPPCEVSIEEASDAILSPTEDLIAGVWSNLLGIYSVRSNDNFFDLGGHSLLATQVSLRLRRLFDREITVRSVFEHPTLKEFAAFVDTLGQPAESLQPALSRFPRDQELPLSSAQERLWFVHKNVSSRKAYNIAGAVRLTGPLDGAILERSFQEIVNRHEILRTSFVQANGSPQQSIHATLEFKLRHKDLRDPVTGSAQAEWTRRELWNAAQREFALDEPSLMLAHLLQVGEQEHILVLVMHHIIADGWSVGVLIRELQALYNAFRSGEPSPLADLEVQYVDYAAWQRNFLTSPAMVAGLDYWRRELAGVPQILELPSDYARPHERNYTGRTLKFTLGRHLTAKVKDICRQEGATLYMALLAAFQVLLFRYSNQNEFVIGSPVAERPQVETEKLIGLFVNLVALRLKAESKESFADLLERVRLTAIQAQSYQFVPFEKVLGVVEEHRALSQLPLLQVVFAWQSRFAETLALGDAAGELQEIENGTAKFDLVLAMREKAGEVQAQFEYSAELFGEQTLQRMAAHYVNVLECGLSNPAISIEALELMGQPETRQILMCSRGRKIQGLEDRNVLEMFAKCVSLSPNQVAIESDGEPVTYAALNERANQLGRYLQRFGVKTETLVGLCMDRSAEAVVAMVGVLKAGAAYVSLDASCPPDRLRHLLAGTQVVCTQSKLAERCGRPDCDLILVDIDREAIRSESSLPLAPPLQGENAAYLIYTSGSTGTPKGVQVTHAALANLCEWHRWTFHLQPQDRTTQIASLGFDASVWEIWSSLTAGATLCVVPEDTRMSATDLQDWLIKEKITSSFLPTPMAEQVLALDWTKSSSLRTLLTGGDKLRRAPQPVPFVVYNNYGPTECAVVATSASLTGIKPGNESPSIGSPIDNAEAYVLDRNLSLVPSGVAGELYLGGSNVARGYWKRPDLTADRFIPNPFSEPAGARLYRTGDLVSYQADGQLKFLGRVDGQVKLRGHRIEVEEVAVALRKFQGVRDAIVMLRGTAASASDQRLVAYVIPKENAALSLAQLRQHLRRQLPDYMIPAAFSVLESFPVNSSGKINHNALPEPELETIRTAQNETSSILTPFEELVAIVWKELLGVRAVHPQDDFFQLGGDSILASKLVLLLEKRFSCQLPIRTVFEFPTLKDLSVQIANLCGTVQAAEIARKPGVAEETFPLSSSQERLWFLDQFMPGSSVYNIPGALRLSGKLNKEAIESSFREIIRRHDVLRSSFTKNGRKPLQQVHAAVDFRLVEKDLTDARTGAASENSLRRELKSETARGFSLTEPGLLRAFLFKTGPQEHVLLVVIHHIIADGWSIGVLVRELTVLYDAFSQGRPSPLRELALQYAHYAAWQRESLSGSAMRNGLEYWKKQLEGAPSMLELPADHQRPALQSFKGAVESWTLPQELLAELKNLSHKQGTTLFMTLLAGFQIVLSRYTGQNDIVVGSPVANRQRAEIEDVIGFFVNILVLRSNVSGKSSVEEALRQVREVCLEAYAHQHVPFDKLVEELGPERNLGRNPLFQVLFVLQNAPAMTLHLPDVEVSTLPVESTTAKFDITLAIEESTEGLRATFEYSTDLFRSETIRRLFRHYRNLLTEIVRDPKQTIENLPLLDREEVLQLTEEWNCTQTEWDMPDDTIVDLIERQISRVPEAIALEFERQRLTYAELNSRANQLARYLQSHGVGVEDRVCLCLARSVEMVIAILAVLKAGAAYVPVADSYPEDRIKYMLTDSGADLVLTQQSVRDRLCRLTGEKVNWLALDSDWEEIGLHEGTNLPLKPSRENLAYVIYTSGSTGMPKGAMNVHSGLHNRLLWMQQTFSLGSGDAVLQKTPFSFDVSVWEFLWPLMTGAKLVVASPGGHRDSSYLVRTIREAKITTLHFVPSMLQAFAQQGGVATCVSLKRVFVSGEALPKELAEKWESAHPAELHNLYGPTEASIDVSWWPCEEKRSWGVPIGKPIANTQFYVVDREGRLAPVGVLGELYLGGVGLGRGYWNRPELTADKFIPDGFSGARGSRLYKTGDLVRFRQDGVLEYVGRADDQVKIRGHRIELGEIESALRQQPGVAEAIVLMREEHGDKRLIACITPDHGNTQPTDEWRNRLLMALKGRLPEYMLPSGWVVLEKMPLSPNGKLDRKALTKIQLPRHTVTKRSMLPQAGTEEIIAAIWRQVLQVPEIGVEDNFFDLGGHSLLLTEVKKGLRESFGASIELMDLFQYPTVRSLSDYIRSGQIAPGEARVRESRAPAKASPDLAIVGMACRFPGARNVKQFWDNLKAGVESVTDFTDAELRAAGVEEKLISSSNYVKRGAVIEDVDLFDARFFNFSAREAELTDPQHRVLLECAWEALESAGYNPDRYGGRIGVYAGSFASTYFMHLYADPQFMRSADKFAVLFANGNDFVATRVSYKLNLTGPSVTVQTGCSTSLVAVHMACRALLSGECEMAMAGGVAIKVPSQSGYFYQEGGIFSPDGRCRPFDANAQGTIGGSGAGMVVIKRLEDAVRDNDHIHAVIKGSAVNNDGANKIGFTAPSINGQREVVLQAHREAGTDPASVSYLEAHGTATVLGDPVEITALTQAFRAYSDKKQFCAVGSVKGNIGHIDTAAGIAGFIKTTLVLENRLIPPTLHFVQANPKIDFASSPFYVNTQLTEWKSDETPRRAAVSSFGIGGTNAHIILEEAPIIQRASACRDSQLLLLSARTVSALETATGNLVQHLESCSDSLADVAHTLQVGRKTFSCRRFVVAGNIGEAIHLLKDGDQMARQAASVSEKQRSVAFLFPGQGSQYVAMGKGLYEHETVFRQHVDLCAEILSHHLNFDLHEVLFPAEQRREWAEEELRETRTTQPALFAIEYALAKLWMSWGVAPDSMLGHSIGEYVAAHLAGVLSLRDALTLVAARGRLMHSCARGGMLSVVMSEKEAQKYLRPGVDLAVVNGPESCVLAGPLDLLEGVEKELSGDKLLQRRLQSSHAFHSSMMEPILKEFQREVEKIQLNPPQMRYLSNVTGNWITEAEATDTAYWVLQLRSTVQFAKGIQKLCEGNAVLTLEVGPGHTASSAVRQTVPKHASSPVMLTSFPGPVPREPSQRHLLSTLGNLWLHGVPIDWNAFAVNERRSRVLLPTYPFERQRYWIDTFASTKATGFTGKQEESFETLPPERTYERPALNRPFAAPITPMQSLLVKVWTEVLGISPIGIQDDFFELGGDSLIALRMTARAQELGLSVSVEQLFRLGTIEQLATVVSQSSERELIPRADRTQPLPLSYEQQRMWFLEQLAAGNSAYNMAARIRLRGRLNVKALEQSFTEVVRRHEILRTVFRAEDGNPVQLIRPTGPWELPVTDLSEELELGAERIAHRMAMEEASRPFDLSAGPLLRTTLLRLSQQDHLLLLTMHHIVGDAWSFEILAAEISTLYESFVEGRPTPLPELLIQYADFAAWEQEWLSGRVLESRLEYWRKQLEGASPQLELPQRRKRPAVQSFRGSRREITISRELSASLRSLSRGQGATLFMTGLSAFVAVLNQYTGQDDVVVGTVIANRDRAELEKLIGFLANTLVLRLDVSGTPKFCDLLGRVKETCLQAYAHQLPPEKLVEDLARERSAERQPLYGVWFQLDTAAREKVQLAGLEWERFGSDPEESPFELSLELYEGDWGMTGQFRYDSNVFTTNTINQLGDDYITLLTRMVEDPERNIADLTLASQQESEQLASAFSGTLEE